MYQKLVSYSRALGYLPLVSCLMAPSLLFAAGTSVSFEAEKLTVQSNPGTTITADAASSGGKWVKLNSTASGQYMEFTTGNVAPGVYVVTLYAKILNTRGISELSVDGTVLGATFDQFAASTISSWKSNDFGTVTFTTSGTHKLRLTVRGKNPGSTGYSLAADKWSFLAQDGAVPVAPTGLNATPISASAIGLSWADSTGATSYSVKRAAVSGGPYTTVDTGNDTLFNDQGLLAGTTYYYVVSAANVFGVSPDSAETSVTTLAPDAPGGLTATAISSTVIQLTWTAISGVTYNVYSSTDPDFLPANNNLIASGLVGNGYSDIGQIPSTTYYYYVTAESNDVESLVSTKASATTFPVPVPPDAPSNLTATAASSSAINLAWTPSVMGGVTYSVYSTTPGQSFSPTGSRIASGLTATTFTHSPLPSSTAFSYVVTAVNDGGESPASNEASATTLPKPPVPEPPTSLSATATSASSITVSWTASVSGAATYNVYRATTSTFTPSVGNRVAAAVTGTSFGDTSLNSSTLYYYQVTAVTADGESLPSNPASATTFDAGFPAGAPVSPYIIGQNDWEFPPDSAWPVIGASGINVCRIGGHKKDVTPQSDAWLLHQVDLMRSVGVEPLIQVSRYASAQTAAQTVRYINITNGRHVKFWSIGNEPDWHNGNPNLASYIAQYTKERAPLMRDVDPSIIISAAELTGFNSGVYSSLVGGANDITGKDAKGRYYVDVISFHRYFFGAGTGSRGAIQSQMHSGFENTIKSMVALLDKANQMNGRTGSNALSWGLTEFNMSYQSDGGITGGGAGSYINGQLVAETYRVAMKYNGMLTNFWAIQEGIPIGFIAGGWTNPTKRSSYYHMQLFSDYLIPGGYLAATSPDGSNLGVVSTSSPDRNSLSVMLLNENAGSMSFTVRLDAGNVTGGGTPVKVPAGVAAEYSGTIGGDTTMVLVFDATGHLKKRVTYSMDDNKNNRAPQVNNNP